MTKLTNPIPLFLDLRGALLDAGRVWVGAAGQDPEANPIPLFWDSARTIAATQPLETMGGRIVNGAYPGSIYFAASDFSIRTRDADGNLVDYSPNLVSADTEYQPLDSDLSAIASLGTTVYGRSLLALANQSALRAATGIPDPLPAVGGTVSGPITRLSSGRYLHHGDTTLAGDTITRGTAEPTGGADGDLYFQYSTS
jgi:hypothetical protein